MTDRGSLIGETEMESAMSCERITCLVPTHNRPQFLRRFFHFYGQFPPGFSFSVIDSSGPSAAAENLAAIERWKGELEIEYRHVDLNFIDKCAHGLEQVRTPFAVLCADDDLVFPDAIRRCVDFLENEQGYASAIGRNTALYVTPPRWSCMVHQGYSIEDDRPFDRCFRMADYWFSNFYAVHRTGILRDIFRITAASTDSRLTLHVPEMLLSQLSVLRGRVRVLPLMYSLLEGHETNSSAVTRTGVQPEAELLYQRFKRCLTEQFEQVGIDRADAERFIDDSYGFFRDPNVASRRRRRSTVQQMWRLVRKITDLTLDSLWMNYRGRSAIKRLLRASDFAECGPILRTAIQLVRDFPHGIPADHALLKRCA